MNFVTILYSVAGLRVTVEFSLLIPDQTREEGYHHVGVEEDSVYESQVTANNDGENLDREKLEGLMTR